MSIPDDFYKTLYAKMPRRLALRPECFNDFSAWQTNVQRKLRELLKLDPAPLPSRCESVERIEDNGLVREKVLVYDPLFGPIPTFVLKSSTQRAPAPGIICLHGHGGYFAGKDMVAGNPAAPAIAHECAEALNYTYGVQLAKAGFVTICPDAWNFGERMFRADHQSQGHVCDKYLVALSTFGFSSAGVTTRGNIMALDYLLGRPDVRPGRVGCIGLSYGGFQALALTAAEPRITAVVISGYATTLAQHTPCGAEAIPAMLEWFDLPDLAASLAPRAALWEMMRQDRCFDFQSSWQLYLQVSDVYKRLGVEDKIQGDTADTDHRYIGKQTSDFFRRHLG